MVSILFSAQVNMGIEECDAEITYFFHLHHEYLSLFFSS